MSDGIWLLLGLLLLAYLGSNLVGGRAIRGFGLPSGSEYLVLGFALGPHVLDVLGRSLAHTFEPVVLPGLLRLTLYFSSPSTTLSLTAPRLITRFGIATPVLVNVCDASFPLANAPRS